MPDAFLSSASSSLLAGSKNFVELCAFGLLRSDNACFYNLSDPSIYLSLGDAIAALALIFAVYQIGANTSDWKIAMKIRPAWQRSIFWIFGALGLLFTALAALVSQFPEGILPTFLEVPLLYELIAFVFFVASPATLFFIFRGKRGLFSKATAEDFYQVLHQEVSRPTSENLDACVNIIGTNLESLVSSLTKKVWRSKEDIRPLSKDEEYAEYASAVFDVILSDSRFINYVVTARLDFVYHLFYLIRKYKLSRRKVSFSSREIISKLYSNPQSHLHTQSDRKGLALSSSLYELIFDDPHIVGECDVFNGGLGSYADTEISDKRLSVFLEAFGHSVRAYWGDPQHWSSEPLRKGLEVLSSYFQRLAFAARRAQRDGDEHKLESIMGHFHTIAGFLGHDYAYPYLKAYSEKKVPEAEANALGGTYSGSLNAEYADTICKFYEVLAQVESTDEVYLPLIEVIDGIENDEFRGARERFIAKMWEKIEKNKQGTFPAILRTYLHAMGVMVSAHATTPWLMEERTKLQALLTELKPRIEANENMVNGEPMEKELLPHCMYYDREGTKEFVYTMGFGRGPRRVFGTDIDVA